MGKEHGILWVMHSEGVRKVHYNCRDGSSTITSDVFTEEKTKIKWHQTHDLLVKGPKRGSLVVHLLFHPCATS